MSGVKASVFTMFLERKPLSNGVVPGKTQTGYIKEDKHVEELGQGPCLVSIRTDATAPKPTPQTGN